MSLSKFPWNEVTSDACERIIHTMTNSTEFPELLLYANPVENDEASVRRLRKLFVELHSKTATLLSSDLPERTPASVNLESETQKGIIIIFPTLSSNQDGDSVNDASILSDAAVALSTSWRRFYTRREDDSGKE